MSKVSDAANALVNATMQVCSLYGVDYFRMQSRVIQVEGTAGRWRPFYIGTWTDRFGNVHTKGMADLLTRPKITLAFQDNRQHEEGNLLLPLPSLRVTVPLWIECKSGTGRLTPDQKEFKAHVEWNGEHYLEVRDDMRPLMAWFEAHDIRPCPQCGGRKWLHEPKPGVTPIRCSACDPRKA